MAIQLKNSISYNKNCTLFNGNFWLIRFSPTCHAETIMWRTLSHRVIMLGLPSSAPLSLLTLYHSSIVAIIGYIRCSAYRTATADFVCYPSCALGMGIAYDAWLHPHYRSTLVHTATEGSWHAFPLSSDTSPLPHLWYSLLVAPALFLLDATHFFFLTSDFLRDSVRLLPR